MKQLFHEDWCNKRLQKIINIFGKSWFLDKKVLELGACRGDMGIELLKIGADVTFTDVRTQHLKDITNQLQEFSFQPSINVIDHEKDYDLKETFDLTIHFGLLYNLQNWKNDLRCAVSHSKIMMLETVVDPSAGLANAGQYEPLPQNYPYGPHSSSKMTPFTQEDVEKELSSLRCKYLRFDETELNSSGWLVKGMMINHIYDWTYEKYNSGFYKAPFNNFRRMWLVIN